MKLTKRDLFGGRGQAEVFNEEALRWWREARFGLFIHWGLYSKLAGFWKGEEVDGIGEWIMHARRIPRNEYASIAAGFVPSGFDAAEWVALAKEAGMKYIVITAKHHDGFAMFDSPDNPYNIVAATPWKRDPLKELSTACAEAGIRLGFYYSQDQDWHDPDGAWNDWDFDPAKKDFRAYLERKVKPQLRELLTGYGPIGLIWFDTPYTISAEHSRELAEYVRSIQPDCLVSGRIGHDLGDYGSLGDNQLPAGGIDGDYETPGTMNDTWGYKSGDREWKSLDTLLCLLVDLAAKGVNYILNVGPDGDGFFPPESVKRLKGIGAWMKINGEAIYGTLASPFPFDFSWGRVTWKRGRLYLFMFSWPQGTFTLYGLKSRVKEAWCLSDPSEKLAVRQCIERNPERDILYIEGFGASPPLNIGVVALEFEGDLCVDSGLMQQPDSCIRLPVRMARIHAPAYSKARISRPGYTAGWTNRKTWLSWSCRVFEPGEYVATVVSVKTHPELPPAGRGHRVSLEMAGQRVESELREDETVDDPRAKYFPEQITVMGRVVIAAAGSYRVKLRVAGFAPGEERSVAVSEVIFRPA